MRVCALLRATFSQRQAETGRFKFSAGERSMKWTIAIVAVVVGVALAAAYKRDNALPRVDLHFPTTEWKAWSDNERRAWLQQRLQPYGLDDDKIERVLKNIGDELGRSGQAFSSPPPRDTKPQ
jgi:hypothetical protein